VRTGGCPRRVAGAPGSAMPLPALWFVTNANTLPLFSAFRPQGSRGTLHPLTTATPAIYSRPHSGCGHGRPWGARHG